MQWRNLMAEIDTRIVDAIDTLGIPRSFDQRAVVFREGGLPDGMYLLEGGRMLIEASTVEGAPVDLTVISPGGIFGAQSLLRRRSARNATVFALQESNALLIRPREFEALRAQFPVIDRFFMLVLDDRLRVMSDRLDEAVHATAEQRVRRRLLVLGDAFDGRIQMSQERLASLAGTTRPTVNRVLRGLEDRGVLTLGRATITLHQPDTLAGRR